MMMTRGLHKEQPGKVSSKFGLLAHRKRRRGGKLARRGPDGSTGRRANIGGEFLERTRIEGSSLKLEVMPKVPELVVREHISQGKWVKGRKEKKKVPGWSAEKMKENKHCCGGTH